MVDEATVCIASCFNSPQLVHFKGKGIFKKTLLPVISDVGNLGMIQESNYNSTPHYNIQIF